MKIFRTELDINLKLRSKVLAGDQVGVWNLEHGCGHQRSKVLEREEQ